MHIQATTTAINRFHLTISFAQTTGEPRSGESLLCVLPEREQQWVMPLAVLWSGFVPGLHKAPSKTDLLSVAAYAIEYACYHQFSFVVVMPRIMLALLTIY
jgi:hypothetical protein